MAKSKEFPKKNNTTGLSTWADQVEITENSKQNGIELLFNREPIPELQSKLRAINFRPSKVKNMWYSENNETSKAFAFDVQSALITSPAGPDLALTPSFKSTRINIEKKEFSFILITLKDDQIKNYIVFEPSKPKAEVIATKFAKEQFGDNFSALAVKPRTQVREARILFDEGKIISPQKQQTITDASANVSNSIPFTLQDNSLPETVADKTRELEQTTLQKFYRWAARKDEFNYKADSVSHAVFIDWFKENAPELTEASIENMWRSHDRIVKSMMRYEKYSTGERYLQPYHSIYKKLLKVIPDLTKHLEEGKSSGKSVNDSKGGLMDLHFDYIGKDKNGNYLIALSHYFKHDGDAIPDPDMEIRIFQEREIAEAMTYQDQFGYQEVYPDQGDGKEYVDLRRKKELNKFLNQWLTNLIGQGHKIDLTTADIENAESEIISESFLTDKDKAIDRSDYQHPVLNRYYTKEKENEILKRFSELGFVRQFSAADAVKQNLPVIDLAFRPAEPMIHFHDRIERPSEQKVRNLQEELNDLKTEKGANDKKRILKEQIEQLIRNVNIAELVVRDELLIFQDDLFAIIFEQAKKEAQKQKMTANDMGDFREYIIDNLFDSRAAESYYSHPLNQVITELINEYFDSYKNNNPSKPASIMALLDDIKTSETKPIPFPGKAIATDLKSQVISLPNVLVPSGTSEPFLSHAFQFYDVEKVLKTNFPQLLKISDKNLLTASGLELFNLLQTGHPTDYGIRVNRLAVLTVWEEKGKEFFDELGLPTDPNYPYVNLWVGYKSLERLGEILFDNNNEGNQWWAAAENYRPIADIGKALEIIDEEIEKQTNEKITLLNSKTNKPKLQYRQLTRDIDYAIASLEEGRKILQQSVNQSSETNLEIHKETSDSIANKHDVYTEETAGENYERVIIPIPKSAQYEAEIRIVKKSDGTFAKGLNASKKFGDYSGSSYPPRITDETYTTRTEALNAGLKEHELRLKELLRSEDRILGNEEKKNKQLTIALNALLDFAKANHLSLDKKNSTVIKGLEAAYWTNEDNKYPFNKVTINGMEFEQVRLRNVLEDKLLSFPFPYLQHLTKELAKRFEERRSLSSYEDMTGSAGKTYEQREAQRIVKWVDDMIVINDIFNQPDFPVMTFLVEELFSKAHQLADLPQHIEKKSTSKPKKQSQHDLNKEIEALIDRKDLAKESFSEEEKNKLRLYAGSGGLINQGATGKGVLYEYYTPDTIIKKIWDVAYHFGYDGGDVLEPSVGIGSFLKYAPKGVALAGYEVNHYAARIAQILYPSAQIHEAAFETIFFAGNVHLKDDYSDKRYSLVIGNPPYGEFSGKYAGMGEKKWTGMVQYEHYFTFRGLDVLKSGGLLIYIIPSNFLKADSLKDIAQKIASKCTGLDRYYLGTNIFKTTDIETDIIALRRN
jgi:uncharacterized protein YqiB (DUF1249 family)